MTATGEAKVTAGATGASKAKGGKAAGGIEGWEVAVAAAVVVAVVDTATEPWQDDPELGGRVGFDGATVGGGDEEVRSFSEEERLEPDAIVTKRSLEGLDAAEMNSFVAVVASLGEQTELSLEEEVTPF